VIFLMKRFVFQKSDYGFDSFSEIASSTLSGKVDASSSMALN
jgi:hypothetical protein